MMSVKIVDSESPYLRMESGVGAGGHSASSQEEQTVGLRKFQRSKPTILGAIEVAIGIFMTLTAIIYLAVDVDFVITAVFYWGIIVYIPAGAMAIATDKKLTKAMVWGTLGMNVLAALSAVAGSVLHFFASVLFVYPPSSRGGQHLRNTEIIMLVLSIVVFIVSIMVAAFAVAALCSSRKAIEVAIGIFMTLTAIIYVAVGIHFVISAILFWEIIVYIPAGAMAIATDKKLTKAMVWGTLGMNVLAALLAVPDSVFHFFASVPFVPCDWGCYHLRNTEIIMTVLSIVVFIVSIVVAAFAVAALCSSRKQSNEHTGN